MLYVLTIWEVFLVLVVLVSLVMDLPVLVSGYGRHDEMCRQLIILGNNMKNVQLHEIQLHENVLRSSL